MACKTCDWEAETGQTVDSSQSNRAWGREAGISEGSIRRHLEHSDKANMDDGDAGGETYREQWKGDEGEITVVLNEKISNEAILKKFGHDTDVVSIVGVLEETHWQMSGEWQHRYKFKTSRKVDDGLNVDPIAILAELRAARESSPITTDWNGQDSAFVLSINDIQLGQSYNGGSPATIANFYRYVHLAQERILDLRRLGRRLEKLVVICGGDLIEGCVIYGNQSFSLDLDRKQQIEGVVGLLLHALDTLAPMFQSVDVLAIAGNHGQHRIGGKLTALGDNDDTHSVEMVKLALARDPNMQHINWHIAVEQAAMAIKVHGWVLMTTHGDVFAKGVPGATTERKAHAWLKNMAASRKHFGNIGDADLCISHHFHHDEMADWGDTLWRQTTSQDRGSPGFSQATGTYSEPGMLTGVMMPGHRWRDEEVLR